MGISNFFSKICKGIKSMSFSRILLPAFLVILLYSSAFSQETPEYKKNAIAVDITQMATNEINLNYERFFSNRRSLEVALGLIYVNEGLVDLSKEWSNTHYFSEHGFSVRVAYKLYKRQLEDSKWRDYIAPAIMYKYLYFRSQWFENEKTDEVTGNKITECLYQNRYRSKFGFEFLWGKVYDFNKTFALEMFYGVGIRATSSVRKDLLKQDICDSTEIYVPNYGPDERFFIRPALRAGLKFRISF